MKIILLVLFVFLIGCQTLTVVQFDVVYIDQLGQHEVSFRWYRYSNGILVGLGSDYKEYEIKEVRILSVKKYAIGIR